MDVIYDRVTASLNKPWLQRMFCIVLAICYRKSMCSCPIDSMLLTPGTTPEKDVIVFLCVNRITSLSKTINCGQEKILYGVQS